MTGGWRTGPDPDAPPWARGRPPRGPAPAGTDQRDDEEDEVQDGGERDPRPDEDPGAGTGAPDSAGDGSGSDAGAPADAAGEGDTTADAAGEGDTTAGGGAPGDVAPEEKAAGALEAVVKHGAVPRPPRRTGIFVDPDDLREHVGALLRTILGGYEVDAFGNFTFAHDQARVFVTVGPSPIGPQVGVFSVTNLDVDLTPELSSFLLTTNHTLGFGSFSYDQSNRAVWLRHTLLGTTLDGPELQSAVAAVATTAAHLDETIAERFGGRTFGDAPEDIARGVEPPRVDQEPTRPPNAGGYL